MKKEVREWEAKYKSLMSLDKLRQQVVDLKNQMAWAFVNEREQKFLEAQKNLKLLESRTHKYTEKVQAAKVSFSRLQFLH